MPLARAIEKYIIDSPGPSLNSLSKVNAIKTGDVLSTVQPTSSHPWSNQQVKSGHKSGSKGSNWCLWHGFNQSHITEKCTYLPKSEFTFPVSALASKGPGRYGDDEVGYCDITDGGFRMLVEKKKKMRCWRKDRKI